MKPPPFSYHRPATVTEAVTMLDELGPDAKILAGGQSLVPMLNMRLATPAHLIDINRLDELAYVRVEPEGVRVGALARHADVEHDAAAGRAIPLLAEALRSVAHPTIRNRGTTVGSIVHADPSGEMTAVLCLLDGEVTLVSRRGERTVPAQDFFVAPLTSAAEADELATSALFRRPTGAATGTAWMEVARRHGDYALCGVGAVVTLNEAGALTTVRTAYISMGPIPQTLDLTLEAIGSNGDWRAVGEAAAAQLEPEEDIHATARYRRQLAVVLTARACRLAAERAERARRAAPSHPTGGAGRTGSGVEGER